MSSNNTTEGAEMTNQGMRAIRTISVRSQWAGKGERQNARCRLYLRRRDRGAGACYVWEMEDGGELGVFGTVREAMDAARVAWGHGNWDLRIGR
jgi:hypothetical protein